MYIYYISDSTLYIHHWNSKPAILQFNNVQKQTNVPAKRMLLRLSYPVEHRSQKIKNKRQQPPKQSDVLYHDFY